jgi:ABC-2 type transport system permease protein
VRLLLRLAWLEAKLFIREPLTVIFTFAFPFFMLVVLAGVFGNEVEVDDPEGLEAWGGVGPVDYYAPAYVALVIASIGVVALPLRLATYREWGVLRRYRAAGFPLYAVLGSQVLVTVVLVVIGAAAIAAATRVFYGAGLPESWPLVILAFFLGLAAFSAIGIALGAVLPSARAAQGAGITLFFLMMMLGGAGPPRGVLSTGLRWAGNPLPLTHVVLAMQDPWLRGEWDVAASALVAAFTAGATVVAARFFRWE